MNTRHLSLAAIGLWGLTLVVGALYLHHDKTRPSSDHRREISLTERERDLVLTEMRGVIGSLNGVLLGISENDRKKIEESARASGMVMAAEDNAGLIAKLPTEFKQMGFGLHRDFDALADAAKSTETPAQLLERTAKLTSRCNGCHQVYRIGLAAHDLR